MRITVHHIDKVQMGRARDLVIIEVSIVDSVATIMDIRVIDDPVLHGPIVIVIVIGGAGGFAGAARWWVGFIGPCQ